MLCFLCSSSIIVVFFRCMFLSLAHRHTLVFYTYRDRSPGDNSGTMSPTSLASHQPDPLDHNANMNDQEYSRTISPESQETFVYNSHDRPPYNNNTLKLDNELIGKLKTEEDLNDTKDEFSIEGHGSSMYTEQDSSASLGRLPGSQYKDNYETTFDLDGNVETKSICSAKSGGSGHDNR